MTTPIHQEYLSLSIGLPKEEKQSLVSEYRTHERDSGSPEVQVAILSKRIADLTTHVQTHKKDHHTRLGLQKMVAKRRRLLNYLKREDFDRYKAVVQRLGIRG
jgi:small subunit ribosomal protein S15